MIENKENTLKELNLKINKYKNKLNQNIANRTHKLIFNNFENLPVNNEYSNVEEIINNNKIVKKENYLNNNQSLENEAYFYENANIEKLLNNIKEKTSRKSNLDNNFTAPKILVIFKNKGFI